MMIDELWILYFLRVYLFYDEFRVGAWDMFFSQSKVLHWKRWLERMEKLVQIQDIHKIYLSDGRNAQFKKRQIYLA
jgi:hypothetical protein